MEDKNDVDSFIAKVDHQFSSNESITGRYAFARSRFFHSEDSAAGSRLPQFAQTSPTRVQLVSASLLSTLGYDEIRFGYSRYAHVVQFARCQLRSSEPGTSTLTFDPGTGQAPDCRIFFGGVFENLGASGFSIPRGPTSQSFHILTISPGTGSATPSNLAASTGELQLIVSMTIWSADCSPSVRPTPRLPRCAPLPQDADDPGVLTLVSFYQGDTFPLANTGNTRRNTFNNGMSSSCRMTSGFGHINVGLRWEYFGPLGESHNLLSNLGKLMATSPWWVQMAWTALTSVI